MVATTATATTTTKDNKDCNCPCDDHPTKTTYHTSRIDWQNIEAKWRRRWFESNDFEVDPDKKRPKKFITVAYPYPNSPQHIGHGRTYTLADVHARFWRMRGYNVLFPMAFHYTGTPILGMSNRVKSGDQEIIDNLRNIYNVSNSDIATFSEPIKIADYFHNEIKSGMIEMGYSIDWRREFTTIDPAYNKFIEWQVNTLKEKGLISRGSHPVGWCPKDQNPVSQHDTLGDVEPTFTEYILIKFGLDDYIIPAATLRPETVFGVTNLWVDPTISYEKIQVNGKSWIVSSECAHKLEFLDKDIKYTGKIKGSELVGMYVSVPGRADTKVVILPALFVESGTGTGIVMSVPAHAPFDYQALKDLKESSKYTLSTELQCVVNKISAISIIDTKGYGVIPAQQEITKLGITSQDDPRLEDATKTLYGKEFYGGILKTNTDSFAGTLVRDSKEPIKKWLEEKWGSEILLELTNAPVRCRCGTECLVKILKGQWFLNYGDQTWKEQASKCLDSMMILPTELRAEFDYVIGWLHERACARQHGLGTKLPWDQDWIVESLSDSVIYMAYYILSKFVNSAQITSDVLSKEFFDYVFLGVGDSSLIDIPNDTLHNIREEFMYFYPVDSRHSGRDLVPNHLTFFVLNHTAIFPKKYWPRQIVVNGSVLMNGSKMSKSMGNIIPLRTAIREYGADPIRLTIIISAELLQDADVNMESVYGIRSKLEVLYAQCTKLGRCIDTDNNDDANNNDDGTQSPLEDTWLLSEVYNIILQVTSSVEKIRLREALHSLLYSFESVLEWYTRRTKAKGRVDTAKIMHNVMSVRIAMLFPFAPHISEEMWESLGYNSSLSSSSSSSTSKWPDISNYTNNSFAIHTESLLSSTMCDIASILKVTRIKPKKIVVYTASLEKFKIYHKMLCDIMYNGKTLMGDIMKGLLADSTIAPYAKKMPGYVQKVLKDILSDSTKIRKARLESFLSFNEYDFLNKELVTLVKYEFGADVHVFSESDVSLSNDPKQKAKHARPFKPAILIT